MTDPAGPPTITNRRKEAPPPTARPGRWNLGLEVWAGLLLILFYIAVAVSALVVFYGSLTTLSSNPAWVPPFHPPPPTWAHPFGVMTGLGTGLFTAIWKATPWDVSIVFGILVIDAGLAILLGSIAGMRPGSWFDHAVTFLSDSLGAIPAVFLAVVLFSGVAIAAHQYANLELFVLIFGVVLWPPGARAVRERARTVSQTQYVEAARASGAGGARVLFRHVMPSSIAPVLAQIPTDVAAVFVVLSVFPWFANCVVPPFSPPGPWPTPVLAAVSPLPSVYFPEWGNLVGIGACWGFNTAVGPIYWWMLVFPAAAIIGLGLGIGLLCDGLDKKIHVRR